MHDLHCSKLSAHEPEVPNLMELPQCLTRMSVFAPHTYVAVCVAMLSSMQRLQLTSVSACIHVVTSALLFGVCAAVVC